MTGYRIPRSWSMRAIVVIAVSCVMASCRLVSGGSSLSPIFYSCFESELPDIPQSAFTPAPFPGTTHDAAIFLVGDAGVPIEDDSSEVLAHLKSEASRTGVPTRVVFLGDNAYPRGLPIDPDDANLRELDESFERELRTAEGIDTIAITPQQRQELLSEADSTEPVQAVAEANAGRVLGDRRQRISELQNAHCALLVQLGAATRHAPGLFVPGNHDWRPGPCQVAIVSVFCLRNDPSIGIEAIQREARFMETWGLATGSSFAPDGGCPGPEEVRVGERVHIVALDTEWFLRFGDGEAARVDECRGVTRRDALTSLGTLLSGGDPAGVFIVVGHHPLVSRGSHSRECGGNSLLDRLTSTGQDLPDGNYRRLIRDLGTELRRRPNLIYAAGHEHNLQVFETRNGPGTQYHFVSGAASRAKRGSSCVVHRSSADTTMLYPRMSAAETPRGYMRLDVFRPRGVKLTITTIDANGRAQRAVTEMPLSGM